MSQSTTYPKAWFRLNAVNTTKDVIEYSTDYKFFRENQILLWKSGKRYTFTSCLEAKTFKTTLAYVSSGELSNVEIECICRSIHKEILNGQHGQGTFVD